MQTFRAYLLDRQGKICWGEWIEAEDLDAATAKAQEMCREGTPTVELWKGPKLIGQFDCSPGPQG